MSKFTVPILDHGFVTLRNLAGPTRRRYDWLVDPHDMEQGLIKKDRNFDADDTDPANAARMSFEQADQERTYEVEMKLNRYLLKNQHMTPFEVIVVWLEMKLPIFIARQYIRHRTQSVSEVSGRYVTLPAEWYIPKIEDVVLQSKDKKQGGMLVNMDDEEQVGRAKDYLKRLQVDCVGSYSMYEQSIADGIAMEQARLHLHLNHYTHWLTTMNLRNVFHFLALRDHSHAQKEAQVYAKAITMLLEPEIPGLMQIYREIMRS